MIEVDEVYFFFFPARERVKEAHALRDEWMWDLTHVSPPDLTITIECPIEEGIVNF